VPAGRNKPARRAGEEAAERLRKPEGGRWQRGGIRCVDRTRDVDGAKRQRDLMEGAGARESSGGLATPDSGGGPKPRGG